MCAVIKTPLSERPLSFLEDTKQLRELDISFLMAQAYCIPSSNCEKVVLGAWVIIFTHVVDAAIPDI